MGVKLPNATYWWQRGRFTEGVATFVLYRALFGLNKKRFVVICLPRIINQAL